MWTHPSSLPRQVPDVDYEGFWPCMDRILSINESLCQIDELGEWAQQAQRRGGREEGPAGGRRDCVVPGGRPSGVAAGTGAPCSAALFVSTQPALQGLPCPKSPPLGLVHTPLLTRAAPPRPRPSPQTCPRG